MKRLLLTVLLLSMLLGACAPVSQESPLEYRFTDSIGNVVSLPQAPRKVAVLFSSYAQIWTLAGGTVAVTVGESVERGFAPQEAALVDNGAGKTIDHELLLAARPDFVIGSADIAAHLETQQMLAKSGIPCALFRVDTFDDYLSMLKICTDITHNQAAFDTYGTAVQQQIGQIKEAVAEAAAAPKVLFIRAGSQYSATKAKRAPENFVCIMLDELGCHNIANDAPVLLDGLSLEEILLQDPEYIFLTSMGSESAAKAYMQDLFSQDGWKDLTAVKNGSYCFLSKDLFHYKPNSRWAEAYAVLAELLYPELMDHG